MKIFHDAVMYRNTQGILQCIDEDTSTLNAPLEVCHMNVYLTIVHLWNAKNYIPKLHIKDVLCPIYHLCASHIFVSQKQITSGQTALHLAARLGFKDVAKVLLQHKALEDYKETLYGGFTG